MELIYILIGSLILVSVIFIISLIIKCLIGYIIISVITHYGTKKIYNKPNPICWIPFAHLYQFGKIAINKIAGIIALIISILYVVIVTLILIIDFDLINEVINILDGISMAVYLYLFIKLLIKIDKNNNVQTINTQKCPYCNETIRQNIKYCPKCGKELIVKNEEEII